jgi:formylglycine-generating enzyme required for sulfatase activity
MNGFARRLNMVIAATTAATFLFTTSSHAVTIDTVPVGNPGNAGESQPSGTFGAVGYNYRIGTTEITNTQYAEFLNGVDPSGVNTLTLYNGNMSIDPRGGINFNGGASNGSKYEIKSGRDNNPVIYVSWYDSIRFANWLHNGQGAGNTEDGAYTLLGGTPTPTNGNSIVRNVGAKWWLPSEDEWYKAAYHKNDGVTGNYWDYPTSTDVVPDSDQPPGSGAPDQSNTANFYGHDGNDNGYNDGYAVTGSTSFPSGNALTDVGAYTSAPSPYGTFDQGGNVWEWTETLISESSRRQRGGQWNDEYYMLRASNTGGGGPSGEGLNIGFRVASIPEPGSITLCVVGVITLTLRRRTR